METERKDNEQRAALCINAFYLVRISLVRISLYAFSGQPCVSVTQTKSRESKAKNLGAFFLWGVEKQRIFLLYVSY